MFYQVCKGYVFGPAVWAETVDATAASNAKMAVVGPFRLNT
jgi:hypothetical protein